MKVSAYIIHFHFPIFIRGKSVTAEVLSHTNKRGSLNESSDKCWRKEGGKKIIKKGKEKIRLIRLA